MKSLTTLIKLHKRTLDELRRKLGNIELQKTELQQTSAKLHEELLSEMELAKKQTEMSAFFGDFAQRIKNRQAQLAQEITALDKQMEKLREEISIAFGELKKYEIALENAKQSQRAEQNRKETIILDEIAAQQHRRKQRENT